MIQHKTNPNKASKMKDDKRLKRKVRNSYIVSTISLALVLFLLGSVVYLIAAAMTTASALQEGITLTVEIRHEASAEAREELHNLLIEEELCRSIAFLSREEKASDSNFREMFQQEFEMILEENPLLDSFEVQLSSRSEEQALVDDLILRLEEHPAVDRVSWPENMAERLHATVAKIRFVLLLFGGALLLISLILLYNTIRLAIFSKRYLINTMKLVGATKWYIMRPFLGESIKQGVWAGLGAALLFVGAIYGLNEAVPELLSLAQVERIGLIVGVMVGAGVLFSLLFTATAVNKFVNMKSSKIHLY